MNEEKTQPYRCLRLLRSNVCVWIEHAHVVDSSSNQNTSNVVSYDCDVTHRTIRPFAKCQSIQIKTNEF